MFQKIQNQFEHTKIDAVLVSDGYNMRYISGFRGATGYLFLTKDKRVLLTDSRYTTQAEKEAKGYEIREISAEFRYPQHLFALLEETEAETLVFEDRHLIYHDWMALQQECPKVKWIPAKDRLNRLRMIKSKEELEKIEKAQMIGDKVFLRILSEIKPGISEILIGAKIDYYLKEEGAEGNSFDTIIASGKNSAMPHAIPTEKKIEKGDFVTMDFGCVFQGYCSDMTRTITVGKANERQRDIYKVVLEAQMAALDLLRPGVTGVMADAAARRIIEKAGYGSFFGHGLGHSLGLFIHEDPRLSPNCQEELQIGMVETVEPGIYIPGFGGVRIEDLVAIVPNGYQNFSHSPKELIEL